MKAFLIELLLKDTERLDWKKCLSSYLKKMYGAQSWSQFYDAQLASDFDDWRISSNGELSPESLLAANLTYYCYLEQLNLRLGNKYKQMKLDITWYDADYSITPKDQKYTQHTIAFEKSSVIYNIAVICNQLAREKLTDDYKPSIGYMTKAMCCFKYLSENFLNSPSIDLQAENTGFLSLLCHAQAQEMFLLKLLNGPNAEKQASLISKLAVATHQLYNQCNDFLKTPEGGITPYGEPRWGTTMTCKTYLYKSIAAFYYALYLEQQNQMGEAIAFTKLAHLSLINALPFKAWLKEFVDFEGLKNSINMKTEQLNKDNDYIYHELIPNSVSLDVVKSMDAIKPMTWNSIIDESMKDISPKCEALFKGIVPMEVYEKESIYSEEKSKMLRAEVEATETADLEYSSFLDFTQLPSLIPDLEKRYKSGEVYKTNPQVELMRNQLLTWIKTYQSSPYMSVEKQMTLIVNKRNEITEVYLNYHLIRKKTTVKLKSSLIEASRSDEKLFSLMKPYSKELGILANDNLLWQTFNKFDGDGSNQESLLDVDDTKTEKILDILKKLRQLSEDLRVLKEERKDILEELKTKVNEDDITTLLITELGKSDKELHELFSSELEKFSPLSTRLEATIFKQVSFINEVKVNLDQVFALSRYTEMNSEEMKREAQRKEFFGRIEKAMMNFTIFASDIGKGIQFYDSLFKMSRDLLNSSRRQSAASNSNSDLGFSPRPALPPQPPRQNISNGPGIPGGAMNTMNTGMENLSLDNRNNTRPWIPTHPSNAPPPAYQAETSTYQPLRMPPHFSRAPIPQPPIPQPPIPQPPTSQFSGGSAPYGQSYDRPAPLLPPKQPSNNGITRDQQFENEEREIRRNPTAIYDKSSVFDENLYYKYSD
ncbi:Bro1p KNAG_0A03580 [Huiozyma naganishii CBS 8797]|uniref:BRO domain-containing protein 1 n=1 Tax=Huiozyma naganishii (strain ATCC MYA-139 / BCRC 22969 / CBS 8797 / KCTC 17520 / NBRC 10181 / NCYC 3082 / Yp74L-3) TaxID=1071383 RepID=J7S297_HUIN7|nr:hypothetical protein KNAG_0A03580 [Kazachstania naganishii CBS 8797]CCK68039.1 hypothetical protein KNAG_0A03580 [Kazachstania naganishii CBS 8797]